MRRALSIALVLAFAAPLVGCKGLLKKREATETASASAAPPPPPPLPSAAVPPSTAVAETPPPVEDAPTPEDFEDEAFEKITAQNFEAELARLKKEIEQ